MSRENILTVIIPVYNGEIFLKRCIESVLNQTLKNIQLIVVDDNSTDNSMSILQEYDKLYENIVLVKNDEQLGPTEARNIAINKVDTKYLTFLDCDDWLDTRTYYSAISELEKEFSCGMAIWGIKTEYSSIYDVKFRYQYEETNLISNEFALALLCKSYNQDISISAVLGNKIFRTSLINSNNIRLEKSYFADNNFIFESIIACQKIILIPDVYLHYFQRADSIMHSFSNHHIDELFLTFSLLKKKLEQLGVFEHYKNEYYCLFRRCSASVLNIVYELKLDSCTLKKYLCHFIKKLTEDCKSEELQDYIDIDLIKKWLVP